MSSRVRVDVTSLQDDNVPDIPLLHFKHADVVLQTANRNLSFTARRNYDAGHEKDIDVRARSEKIEYASLPSTLHANYMLGVCEAASGTLRLYPAVPIEMAPRISGGIDADAHISSQLDTNEKRMQARAQLVESFGGKRQRRILNSRTRYKLSASAMEEVAVKVEDAVSSRLAEEAKMKESEQSSEGTVAEGRLLPPNNLGAETPADVYPLSLLITERERNCLEELHEDFRLPSQETISKWRTRNQYMPFVVNCLSALDKSQKSIDVKVMALKYLVELLKFHAHLSKMRRPKRSDLSHVMKSTPGAIIDAVVAKFLVESDDSQHLTLTKQRRHLLYMYLIALGLHACDYRALPLDDFATELNITVQDKRSSKRQADEDSTDKELPSKRAKEAYLTSLRLPLKFPTRSSRLKR
eukprot:gene9916-2099_t